MQSIRILSDSDVRNLLDIKQTLTYVEKAYAYKANQQARLFPIISEDLVDGRAEMDIKSGMLHGEQVFGMKLVSWFGDNIKQRLPAITGLTMLFDLSNGYPKGMLNAGYVTGMRTGAAGALGVKHLAKPDSQVLFVMGTGGMAVFQIAATLSAVQSLNKVYLYDPLHYDNALLFEATLRSKLGNIKNDFDDADNVLWLKRIKHVSFECVKDPTDALSKSDAVITVTPSRKPLIKKEWIKPGTHLSCVGADAVDKQEIDAALFGEARVFVDDVKQATTVGETQSAFKDNIIVETDLFDFGDLILNRISGRRSNSEITIFDSTGISLQDLAVANYLLEKAEQLNVGSIVPL